MVSNCKSPTNLKHKSIVDKRPAASQRKEDSNCSNGRQIDVKPTVGIDLTVGEHANSPDETVVEDDDESTEETSYTLPEEGSKKKIEGTRDYEILNKMENGSKLQGKER